MNTTLLAEDEERYLLLLAQGYWPNDVAMSLGWTHRRHRSFRERRPADVRRAEADAIGRLRWHP